MRLRMPVQILAFALSWLTAVVCLADEASVLVTTVAMKKSQLTTSIASYAAAFFGSLFVLIEPLGVAFA